MKFKSLKHLRRQELTESWMLLNKILLGRVNPEKVLSETAAHKYNESKTMLLYNYANLCSKLGIYGTRLGVCETTSSMNKSLNVETDRILSESAALLNDENIKNILKEDVNLVYSTTKLDKKFILETIMREHLLKTAIDEMLITPVLESMKLNGRTKLLKSPEISNILETHANIRNILVNTVIYETE